MIQFLIALALIASVGAGLYFFVIKKKAAATVPPVTGWQFQYSTGVSGTPEDFDFPASDGVHYCVKPSLPLNPGQTVTMKFTISGTGVFQSSDPNEGGPCKVRLYLQRVGDNMATEFYRFWSHDTIELVAGEFILSVPLNVDNWGGVGGGLAQWTDPATGFSQCLNNLANIGFTFGGQWFAGHGVYANGPVHFHLNEFSVT